MKNRDWSPFLMNRRTGPQRRRRADAGSAAARGASCRARRRRRPRRARRSSSSSWATTAWSRPASTLGGSGEPERFWPTATGTLTKDKMLADKADADHRRARRLRGQAAHRPRHQPPLQLDGLLAFGGGCADPHRRRRSRRRAPTAKADGDLRRYRDRRRQRTRPGATRSCSTRACFHPAARASTFPGTSRTSPRNSRACTSIRRTRRTRRSSARSATARPCLGGGPGGDAARRAQQEHQRHSPPANPGPAGADGSQHERSCPARSAPDRDPRHRGQDRDHDADHPGRGRRDDEDDRPEAIRPGDARRGRQAVHGSDGVLRGGRLQPRGGAEDRRSHRRSRVHVQRPDREVSRRFAPASRERARLPPSTSIA